MTINNSPPSPPPSLSPAPGRSLPRWMKAIALLLILLGIGFRCTNLDLKPFWEDEVYTMTRASGYQLSTIEKQLNEKAVVVADLERYRTPKSGQSWLETARALASASEHTPLYFLILRGWSQIVGHSTVAVRSLSVVFSIVGLGAFYGLGRSLFPLDKALGDAAGWGAATMASLSPLLLRYSQETRSYSLWVICLCLSTGLLLRAWRSPSRKNWILYGGSMVLAFYTHLLTLFIMVAHAIALIAQPLLKHRRIPAIWQRGPVKSWVLTTLASLVAMGPWLAIVVLRQGAIKSRTNWLTNARPFYQLMRRWGIEFSHTWLDFPHKTHDWWPAVTLILFIGVAIATVYLWRRGSQSSAQASEQNQLQNQFQNQDGIITLLSLTVVPALIIVLMDLVSGGQRSAVNRYFIPAYVGLVTLTGSAVTVALVGRVGQSRPLGKTIGLWSATALLVITSALSCGQLNRATTWWNLSAFIPTFAEAIAAEPDTLVLSDRRLGQTLALAYNLPDNQPLLWTKRRRPDAPQRSSLPIGDEALIIFDPSEGLQEAIASQRGEPLPEEPSHVSGKLNLWLLKPVAR